jgi:hypothetical protein
MSNTTKAAKPSANGKAGKPKKAAKPQAGGTQGLKIHTPSEAGADLGPPFSNYAGKVPLGINDIY